MRGDKMLYVFNSKKRLNKFKLLIIKLLRLEMWGTNNERKRD